MTTALSVSKEHITKTPGVCGGKACIAGHRIRVMDVVIYHEYQKRSPEEIVAMFPTITLADVYAAVAYYFDHPDEIAAEFAHEEDTAARLQSVFPSKLKGVTGG